MLTHTLKIDATPLNDLLSGAKTSEVRHDDRDFEVGDTVYLTCSDGRAMERTISHIQRGYGLPDGICVLSYTRPIAPVAGLETSKVEHRVYFPGEDAHTEWREGYGMGLYPQEPIVFVEVREHVTRSQAEAILAAKDAEWQVAANLGSEVNRNLASRVNALEADNAALTARVKRLDTPYNPMAEALATDKVKTLEAQLAAAEMALEPFSKYAAMLFERNYNDTDIINVFGEHRLTARDFFDARVASETGR